MMNAGGAWLLRLPYWLRAVLALLCSLALVALWFPVVLAIEYMPYPERVWPVVVMGLVLVLGVAYSVKAGEVERLKNKRKAKR